MATATHEARSTPARGLSTLDWIFLVLLAVGGLNWGLVGLFDFDLVAAIFGPMSVLARAVYVIVGISALYCLFRLPRIRR